MLHAECNYPYRRYQPDVIVTRSDVIVIRRAWIVTRAAIIQIYFGKLLSRINDGLTMIPEHQCGLIAPILHFCRPCRASNSKNQRREAMNYSFQHSRGCRSFLSGSSLCICNLCPRGYAPHERRVARNRGCFPAIPGQCGVCLNLCMAS